MMTRRVLLASLLALAAGLSPGLAEARCAPPGLEVSVLTPASLEVPLDGSFLVQLIAARPGDRALHDFPANLAIEGPSRIELTLTPIAPGLARATPSQRAAEGTYRLVGSGVGGARMVRFAGGATMPAAPSAPRVRRVTYRETPPRSRRARATYDVEAVLAAPAPASALIVAAIDASGHGSWHAARAGERRLQTYSQLSRCGRAASGWSAHRVGAQVRVVFVDAYGRTAESGPMRIVAR